MEVKREADSNDVTACSQDDKPSNCMFFFFSVVIFIGFLCFTFFSYFFNLLCLYVKDECCHFLCQLHCIHVSHVLAFSVGISLLHEVYKQTI